jgi:transposase
VTDPAALRTALEALRDQPEALIAIILQQSTAITQLQTQVAELEARLHDLDDDNRRLRDKVLTAEAAAARPAAPFRIKDHKRQSTPRRPGRPTGHPGTSRQRPPLIDAEIVVPLDACPHCGGTVAGVRAVHQFIEEIPEMRPHVTHLVTHVGRCPQCAQSVASTHPLQVSRAQGAAGVQLGPRALALAADLNKRVGLTMRTTCHVLRMLGGLQLTPGGLAQAVARLADRLGPVYVGLQQQIRAAPVVHSDETSWWVGGRGHWLWVFATPTATLYRVVANRNRATLVDTLGADYAGVLVSDCLAIYDGGPSRQQKCYAHHLKAIGAVVDLAPSAYAEQWRALLRAAIAYKCDPAPPPHLRQAFEIAADLYLADPRRDPHEEALRLRLVKQRDHLFTFLDYAEVPATNNLAERQLRPAVIARKLSCGNKTATGARTWEILASIATTWAQRGDSFLTFAARHATLAYAR